MNKDLNRPRSFFNFVGPESDSTEYNFSEPPLGSSAAREVNLLGSMERPIWPDFPAMEASARRRIAVMRREKRAYDVFPPSLGQLRRPVERDPTFLLPAPPEFIRSMEMGPPPPPETMIAFGRRRGLSIGGVGTSATEAAAANKAAMGELDHVGDTGSSSANPNKKMKQVCVEPASERLIFPKPMYARGPGSGSGDVVLGRGYLSTGSDERVRIVCMCHNQAHTPEEFVAHSGGRARGGAGDPPCFVTVTRGDAASCIHARG